MLKDIMNMNAKTALLLAIASFYLSIFISFV